MPKRIRKSRRPVKKIIKKAAKTAKKTVRAVRSGKAAKRSPKRTVRRSVRVPSPQLAAAVRAETFGAPAMRPEPDHRLPAGYNEDKLALLVRDPWWLFAYWEVTPVRRDEVARRMREAGGRDWKTVLRVYDVTQASLEKPRSFFDIELNFYTDNWYVDVGLPDREWMAEIGLRAQGGRFIALVTSNRVKTPSFGVSEVLDEEWMMPDDTYYRLIGLSGINAQQGSLDVRKILEKYLKRLVSSGSLPQVSVK